MIGAAKVSDCPPLSPEKWKTSPALGLLSTVFGTALAVALVPEDVYHVSSLTPSALCVIAGSLLVPIVISLQWPPLVLHPLHVVVGAPVYWLLLDVLQGAYELPGVTQEEVQTAFIAIGCFVASLWAGALLRPWAIPRRLQFALNGDFSASHLFGIILLAFTLAFLRFAVPANFNLAAMLSAFTVGRWSVPWGRGGLGSWDAFLNHMGYFGYVLPSLTVLMGRKVGWLDARTLLSLVLAVAIALLESTGGGRRILGVMAGSALAVWFLSAYSPKLRHVIISGLVCALLLGFMQLVLVYRNVGILSIFSDERPDTPFEHLHVDDNFLRLCQIVGVIPEHHDYVTWRYVLFIAVRPVPRVIWPGKPVSPGFELHTYLGAKNVSYSLSIIGELYMCCGLIGCCMGGLLMGWMARSLSAVLLISRRPGALIVFGIGLLALFAGVRSGIDLVLMNYGLLAWVALVWMYRHFRPEAFAAIAPYNARA